MSITDTMLQKLHVVIKDIEKLKREVFGNGDKIGLDEQVRLNTMFRRDMKKFFWIVITVLSGQTIVLVVLLMSKVLAG